MSADLHNVSSTNTPELFGRLCYILSNFPEFTLLPIRTASYRGGKPYSAMLFRVHVPSGCGFTLNDLITDLREVLKPTDKCWSFFSEFVDNKTYLKLKVWL